ncbi:MAG: tetratricopeptide repeat protein [Rhodospirillaceae bacterium]|nr:tetratricopeptide repeat protein [Rhodospirillaceae bacterium]
MSSGSLTADRRFAYAQSLKDEGDFAAAAEVMAQALEEAPRWAEGRFTLAELLAAAGDGSGAIAAYRAYLKIEPADSMGAGARLALLGESAPASLPDAYVRRLFDQYATRFDSALVEKLKYRAPELLRAAIVAVAPDKRFARCFDLGCGTGLAGAAVRDLTAWLGGVDLSPAMVRAAEQKRVYDHLESGDMVKAVAALPAPCDLMLAADVLVYCGDLVPLFRAVALKSTGLFAFTVQRANGGTFALGPEQRFNHSRAYLSETATAAGFTVLALEDAVTRQEKGADVPGLLAVLSRAPA